ncbi:TIGR03016 family PEP-CTERM system-associated outer membrane protein [Methylomonas fluvii]|nr:TIGR03016 family PEP-CTERM system-associated outer membrane protein [Methylomonas fluvii]
MGNMDICDSNRLSGLSLATLLSGLSVGMVLHSSVAKALDWRFSPSLSASEIFSDNLTLSENNKKSGFVTEISPGVSLYGDSPWSNFNLNYRMQGLYNAGGRDAIDINHQLNMNSLYQAVRNTLFLETASSISQQNISNSFVTTDNISGNGGRTEVKTFSISPYWTPRFGQFATGLAKVGYSKSSFENLNGSSVTPQLSSLVSDSDTITRQARLSSGSYFNRINWGLNYSSQEQSRAVGQDVRFEQYQGNARYYINNKFNLFGQAGFENNDFQTSTNSISNGFFYTVGGQWTPSKWYSLEVGIGNNKHATLQFNPSENLSSTITYRNKDVGLNTGDSWDANFNYRAKQASIAFNYSQETTTMQQLFAEQGFFLRDASGSLTQVVNTQDLVSRGFLTPGPTDPITGRSSLIPGPNFNNTQLVFNPFDLVNDVIIRKRGNLSFSYQTGKSSYTASVFNERRTYETRSGEDMSYGVTGSWQWQFASRMDLYLRPSWQHTDGELASNSRYDVALGVSRGVPINLGRPLLMDTRLEFRHINQISDSSQFNGYVENRATANFNVRF